MSNYRAIAAMTMTFRNIVQEAIQELPGARAYARRPGKESANSDPKVYIFLYEVATNANWRNMEVPVRHLDGSLAHRPQVALDLHYLLTFYGDEDSPVPQLLLGKTVIALQAQPNPLPAYMPRRPVDIDGDPHAPYALWDSGLREQIAQLQIIPESLSHEELSRLWPLFFQTPYVLSCAYRVSVILLTDDRQLPAAPLPTARPPRLYAASEDLPEIEHLVPQWVDHADPAEITLRGRNLAGSGTSVLINGQTARIRAGSGGSLVVSLPQNLPAGVCSAIVTRDLAIGPDGSRHRVFESNVACFVLRPIISHVEERREQRADSQGVTRSDRYIVVQLAPIPRAGQRATFLLNEADGDASRPSSYTLPAKLHTDRQELWSRLPASMRAGSYLVRVRIGDVTTTLFRDPDPHSPDFDRFVRPMVDIS